MERHEVTGQHPRRGKRAHAHGTLASLPPGREVRPTYQVGLRAGPWLTDGCMELAQAMEALGVARAPLTSSNDVDVCD